MSRRRGEFEHRTSIFEGAFRAWSHMGGLSPEVLEASPPADLDPLTAPIAQDSRLGGSSERGTRAAINPDGSQRHEYPYEPLPRSGLAHPYVQAILSPWLGADADNDAIQLGLTTLRTWWQHRRKGESGSAIAALGTEKMKGVVEGYTRHFFTLAHCLVINDNEQPPRTLHTKMKELEKKRKQQSRKVLSDGGTQNSIHGIAINDTSVLSEANNNESLSPLERLHQAQRQQLQQESTNISQAPVINIKGKCIPGKIDLGGMVDTVNHHATQLAHRGGGGKALDSDHAYGDPTTTPVVLVSPSGHIQIALTVDGITCAHCVKIVETVLRGCNGNKSPIEGLVDAAADRDLRRVLIRINQASNAKRVAFEAARNLAMVGYTAKVKEMSIVDFRHGDRKSTMDLGALATAFEVVGTTNSGAVGETGAKVMFDWSMPCTCPDNGVLRNDCQRHAQMSKNIFEAFDAREQQVTEYMAGCGMKYGMECTCGPDCRCRNCELHGNVDGTRTGGGNVDVDPHLTVSSSDAANITSENLSSTLGDNSLNPSDAFNTDSLLGDDQFDFAIAKAAEHAALQAGMAGDSIGNAASENDAAHDDTPLELDQNMDLFGMGPPRVQVPLAPTVNTNSSSNTGDDNSAEPPAVASSALHNSAGSTTMSNPFEHAPRSPTRMSLSSGGGRASMRMSLQYQRNPSVLSYGNTGIRHMSMNSETTFGRAMSGLSALSIDWENLGDDDFDVNVDHSAHINNLNHNPANAANRDGGLRSSFRRSYLGTASSTGSGSAAGGAGTSSGGSGTDDNAHVSFKV